MIRIGQQVKFIFSNAFFQGLVTDKTDTVTFVAVVGYRQMFQVPVDAVVPIELPSNVTSINTELGKDWTLTAPPNE